MLRLCWEMYFRSKRSSAFIIPSALLEKYCLVLSRNCFVAMPRMFLGDAWLPWYGFQNDVLENFRVLRRLCCLLVFWSHAKALLELYWVSAKALPKVCWYSACGMWICWNRESKQICVKTFMTNEAAMRRGTRKGRTENAFTLLRCESHSLIRYIGSPRFSIHTVKL